MSETQTMLGPYRVVRALGQGRFGEVFLVSEPLTGAWHVAKVLRTDVASRTEQKDEFRLLAHLDHPNLLIPWSLEEYGGRLVLLMQHVDGRPFDVWVGDGPEPMERLARLLPQLLAGLHALHQHGVLHLDIKPANVLVTEGGELFLLDFGLSRPSEARTDDIRGTFAYVAPEVFLGGGYTEAADLFAAGVMCFEAVQGTLPFARGGHESFTARMLNAAPAELDTGRPVLDVLLRRLMEPDPVNRPSASEALDWLGERGAGLPPRVDGLVGRRSELSQLQTCWAAVHDGGRHVVQVVGQSGMGKSALVEHFARHLARPGVVLSGRCFERDATPYKGLDSVMAQLGTHLASLDLAERSGLAELLEGPLTQLFPELAVALDRGPPPVSTSLPPGEVRQRAMRALRTLISRVTRAGPLLLWLDDVQWGDRDGAIVLLELMRAPCPSGVMIVLSHRPEQDDPGGFLDTWRRGRPAIEPEVSVVEVGRMTDADAREMGVRLLGRERGVDLLVDAAEGCPFILEVLVRAGVEQSGLTAEQTMGSWVAALDEVPRQMLAGICLAGRPLLREQVPGLPAPQEQPRAWSALLRRRLVRSVGAEGRVEPYHDRIRRTMLRMLSREERLRLHGALGDRLSAGPRPDAEGAALHLSAGDRPSEALPWAVRAAEQAAEALAFDQAARLYGLAARCCGDDRTQAAHLRRRQAHALADARRAAKAVDAADGPAR